jgi:catalase
MHIQARLKAKSGASQIARTFHAKPLLAVTNAHFEIAEDLAEGLRVDCFQPGVCYDTTVRFSNASGMNQPDSEHDLRGAAMRLRVADHEGHDLLMTNFPVSHARDAKQFVAFAQFGPETSDLNYLRQELGNRLAKDDVAYEFCLQRFVDERQTPIENAAVE